MPDYESNIKAGKDTIVITHIAWGFELYMGQDTFVVPME